MSAHANDDPAFAESPTKEQMTVEEKLRAAQLEAEKVASTAAPDVIDMDESLLVLETNEDINLLRSPAKKTRIKGRPKRRKSTLSPEELENLLGLE